MRLALRVNGRPAPQGSKHKGAHGQMREASPYLAAWRAAVRNTAHRVLNEMGVPPAARPYIRGAVVVRYLEFVVHPGQRVDSPPDLDKLLRAVLDALKYAGVFEDDGRVVRVEHLSKRHPAAGVELGCYIEMESFQETEKDQMDGKLYRLVLEEVELNGSSPVTVGQVVGDARMVESVLPALAQRLTANGTSPAEQAVPPASAPAAPPAAVEQPTRKRGRPSKAEIAAREAAAGQPAPPAVPATGGVVAGQAAYDPFAAVAGQQ